jgi:hypothetical protein
VKKIFTILLVVALALALTMNSVLASPNVQSVNQAGGQQAPCPCGENSGGVLSLPEEAEANKAVALVLASDDFHYLRKSIREDGLHFDAGQHQEFLMGECEDHHVYIVYFGFEPSVTGSRVGIIAFVDVLTETILVIGRVDQSSPDPQGLRTVTVQTPAGDTEEFTITWDIEPHNFDWNCFLTCFFPPPEPCVVFFYCCIPFPHYLNPCCVALLGCGGIMAIICATRCD